jgi:hypothetical protein
MPGRSLGESGLWGAVVAKSSRSRNQPGKPVAAAVETQLRKNDRREILKVLGFMFAKVPVF